MRVYGERAAKPKELRLMCLLTIYVIHCLLLVVYGFDYMQKEQQVLAHEAKSKNK